MRMQVRSLALLSGLRIQRYYELWCRPGATAQEDSRALAVTGNNTAVKWSGRGGCLVNSARTTQCSRFYLCSVLIWSGLVFVLFHHHHRVTLSRVSALWNSSCPIGEHQDPAIRAGPAPSCQQPRVAGELCFSFAQEFVQLFPIPVCGGQFQGWGVLSAT